MEMAWVEKYRPHALDDVVGHEQIVRTLKAYAISKNPPHMIFAGPAGTGKTTCAIALAREMFGDSFDQNFLELNASDDRGINVVRDSVKNFASSTFLSQGNVRLLFLDEGDNLTSDAQAALRRTIEQYSHTFRMIISCNYSSRLIAPIVSRCAVFRFRPLERAAVTRLLDRLAERERLNLTAEGRAAIIDHSRGDMRRAVNTLQMCAMTTHPIKADLVRSVTATADPDAIRAVIRKALAGSLDESRAALKALIDRYGIAGQDFLQQFHRELFTPEFELGDHELARMVVQLGEIDFHIAEGCRSSIQLDTLLARLVQIGAGGTALTSG